VVKLGKKNKKFILFCIFFKTEIINNGFRSRFVTVGAAGGGIGA